MEASNPELESPRNARREYSFVCGALDKPKLPLFTKLFTILIYLRDPLKLCVCTGGALANFFNRFLLASVSLR